MKKELRALLANRPEKTRHIEDEKIIYITQQIFLFQHNLLIRTCQVTDLLIRSSRTGTINNTKEGKEERMQRKEVSQIREGRKKCK